MSKGRTLAKRGVECHLLTGAFQCVLTAVAMQTEKLEAEL